MTSLLVLLALAQSELRVPGFTAYLKPNPDALEIDGRRGIQGWNDPKTSVSWFGKLAQAGNLTVKVELGGKSLAYGYALRLDGQTHKADLKDGVVDFGTYKIGKAGYKEFRLEAFAHRGFDLGSPQALVLGGPAIAGAQFNLVERRNAASVHLGYPTADGAKIVKFYNEVTAREEPIYTYYMACGFRRGYFGMQVNSPTERRIIFSVWDSGNEAVDRNKVDADNRVKLLAKGDGVVASDFGNEGTGGHSHKVYMWKKGQTYRFCVTAKPDGTGTIYSGYFWFPETKAWGLIASFRAPKDGGYLRGLYSFNENFGGTNGFLMRRAEFGNQWVQTEDGNWTELTKARFTHDATGKMDRKDYAAGPLGGGFFLQNGGYADNGVKLGDTFDRTPTGRQPDVSGIH